MKILVVMNCSEGGVLPMIPIAWALRSEGHDVLVTAPANMGRVITEAGLVFAEATDPVEMPEMLSTDRDGNHVPMPSGEEELLRHIGRGYGRLALRIAEGARRIAEAWQPELIVAESYTFAGPLVAAQLGIPYVTHEIRLSTPRSVWTAAEQELAPELSALGRTEFPDPVLSIDICPPSLRPDTDEHSIKMRYVPYNGRIAEVPAWVFAERSKPRLLLTLGTRVPLINSSPITGGNSLLEDLMHRLATLDLEVVVAVSDKIAATFGPLPANVIACGHLPLSQILPVVDYAVHHGGVGTTLSCISAGVPQVSIPVIAEVWETSRLLVKSGAGLELPFKGVSAEAVFEACRTLLNDPSYTENAQLLQKELFGMPTPAEVAQRIGQL